ncbi:beta-ketoacyl-[acyl-carrier-protein] synthase family protein [Streptomyces formicae]|uniref:3-oxoacyl-[acyl-carrier-protein] synthase, KASII n=1 Tax=Streptomyces formicae TaxID=1616117 RepID=A0A291QHT0_9ACTN|nr:beta-ketoacyl-[acyl-carrier-protein] synthase family protein [Streptomyces formicae]ATL31279.1 3-oxoacyl-[acyl-carrier-protein] synthase, KASII [Streptomyces formicae]
MERHDIAVTGLGLVTPAGIGVETNWETVCAGRPTAAVDESLADNPVRISSRVPGFDAAALLGARRAHRLDRFVQYALVALHEALADAGLDPTTWDAPRVGVVLGTAQGGQSTVERQHQVLVDEGASRVSPLLLPMQLPNMLAGQVAMECGARGPNLVVATACASGTTAVGVARDLLLLDRCDIVITGGSDAMVTPLVMAGFAQMGALSRRQDDPAAASRPFDADRDGFVGGEGAGILVLERLADARARSARVHARVAGYGAGADAHHLSAPDPQGRGIEAAVRAALADAGAGPADVRHINAHGTSTPLNDRVEAETIERVFPEGPLVTSTKGVTGHLLGAAGAVESIYTVLAIERGVVPPTANLSTLDPAVHLDVATRATEGKVDFALSHSMGFGGQNAVLAFQAA